MESPSGFSEKLDKYYLNKTFENPEDPNSHVQIKISPHPCLIKLQKSNLSENESKDNSLISVSEFLSGTFDVFSRIKEVLCLDPCTNCEKPFHQVKC